MSSLQEVLTAARSLPEDDRLQLVDELIATLEPDDKALLDAEWLAEIQRRSREYDAGRMQAVPWEVVKKQARKRVFGDG